MPHFHTPVSSLPQFSFLLLLCYFFLSLTLHPDFCHGIKISVFHRVPEKKGKWTETERERKFDTDFEIYL